MSVTGLPECKVFVCHLHTSSMVKVRAPREIQLSKELWKGIELFEGVNQQCLLPVGQELQIDAQVFFLLFHWPSLRDRARVADAGCHAAAIRVVAPARPALVPAVGCCCVSWMREPQGPSSWFFPVVQRRPAYAELFSHSLRTFLSTAKADDSSLLQCLGIAWTTSPPDNGFPGLRKRLTNPCRQRPHDRDSPNALIVAAMQRS